jgi:hypothetical protein
LPRVVEISPSLKRRILWNASQWQLGLFLNFYNENSPGQAPGYQRPKTKGRKPKAKTSKHFQLDILVMKPFVVFLSPLILYILPDHLFTAMTSYATDIVAFGPKFTTPQLLFDRRDSLKNLPGSDTFDDPDNLRWAIARY